MERPPRASSSTKWIVGVILLVFLATAAATLFIVNSDPTDHLRNDVGPEPPSAATKRSPVQGLRARHYPSVCLRKVPRPTGLGLVATAYNRAVTIGSPNHVIGRVRGSGPVSWSPSGKYFAVRYGAVYDIAPTLILQDTRLEKWGWSPIADCLVGVTKNGTVEVRIPNGDGRVLISDEAEGARGAVNRFRFSTNGRLLQVRFEKGTTAVLDLRRNRFVSRAAGEADDFEPRDDCPEFSKISSESCSTDGRYVVGIQDDRLVLVGENGTRPLAFGPYEERFPEWGPPRTGVLFLRRPNGEDRVEVWFIPEGGTAQRTPFVIPAAAEGWDIPFPWEGVVDWSVSPPTVRCVDGHCLSN